MKTNFALVIVLAMGLVGSPTWAQEMRLIIDPAFPHSNQTITFSVTNSACFSSSQILGPDASNNIQITLTYFLGNYEECINENPDAPDFETSIGPLSVGTYRAGLRTTTGGIGGAGLVDSRSFSVVAAQPGTTKLSEGGITGLYHDPQAPHRYFYVLQTDYTTLVVWNTFDSVGNQLWVYGVGDIENDGSTVIADAYINTSGGFLPSGEVDDDVEPWGLIRLDLSSCTEGTVSYQSNQPEFGSDEFSVKRLASSKQIGCAALD